MFTKHERLISVEEGSCFVFTPRGHYKQWGEKRTQVTIGNHLKNTKADFITSRN